MEIYLNSDNTEDIKVDIKGIDNNVEEPEDILFNAGAAVSTIVGEMAGQLLEKAPWEDKKKIALAIVDTTKTMVEMYYDAMIEEYSKKEQEVDLYGFMCDCFDMVICSQNIDEAEIVALAKTVEPVFSVDENDGLYYQMVSFGDKAYILGETSCDLSDEMMDKETMKASLTALILFDKAFPDDESKNPVRQLKTFNMYHDLIKEKYGK